MDDGRVDGRAAQTQQHQARQQGAPAQRQQNEHHARRHDGLSQTDHLAVAQFHGDKAAREPSRHDAGIVQAGPAGGGFRVNAAGQHAVAGRPHTGGGFQRTVAEKAEQHFPHTGQAEQPGQRQMLRREAALLRGVGGAFPQRQAAHQHHGERRLQQADGAVAVLPAAARQRPAHDDRPHAGAHAPHGVQPAHVTALVMQRNVVVQRGVHAARAEAVGDGPQAELPERRGEGKPEQRRGGERHAARCDPAGAELGGEAVTGKAGGDGAQTDDDGHHPRPGQLRAQLGIHGRPRCPQQGVRQAKADEGKINDGEQNRNHNSTSCVLG